MDRETTARAIGRELHVSPKKSREICRHIKGMTLEEARDFLDKVTEQKAAVPYLRYKRSMGHKPGMAAGGYPLNAATEILNLLDSAENNAEFIGYDTERMFIAHIAAHRGRRYIGMRPRAHGRSSPKVTRTTNIEIILAEKEEE